MVIIITQNYKGVIIIIIVIRTTVTISLTCLHYCKYLRQIPASSEPAEDYFPLLERCIDLIGVGYLMNLIVIIIIIMFGNHEFVISPKVGNIEINANRSKLL